MLIRKLSSLEPGDKFIYEDERYKVEKPYNEHSDEVWCKNMDTGISRLLRGKYEVELGWQMMTGRDSFDLDR